MDTTSEKPVQGEIKPEEKPSIDQNAQTEKFRFYLAMVLIMGFLILIGLSLLGGYTDPLVLAGIFSGWIAAVMGFYFIQQGADKAHAQALEATKTSTAFQKQAESSTLQAESSKLQAESSKLTSSTQMDEVTKTAKEEIEKLTQELEKSYKLIAVLLKKTGDDK